MRLETLLIVATVWHFCWTGPVWSQNQDGEPNNPPAEESFVKDGQVDVDAVVKYFEDLYRSDSSISTAKLIVTTPRHERTLEMKIWTRGEEKALIVIQAPPREKGTATLKVDNNLWNYLPRIKRTIRIPPSMMLASWMGSDFTNDDLVKDASYSKDYEYELIGPSEDPEGWRVRFTAKPDLVGLWNRFELVLTKDARIPLEAEYYDRKDRLARNALLVRRQGVRRQADSVSDDADSAGQGRAQDGDDLLRYRFRRGCACIDVQSGEPGAEPLGV